MPRYIFAPDDIASTGSVQRLEFYDRATGGKRLTDLYTIDGSDNTVDAISNGVVLTDELGAGIGSFAGPDDMNPIYMSVNGSSSRTLVEAARMAASQGDLSAFLSNVDAATTYSRRWRQSDLQRPGRAFLPTSEDPPVVGVSSHNGATSIANSVAIDLTSAQTKVRIDGAPNLSVSGAYINNILYDEYQSFSIRYVTDATYHEVSYQASASPSFRMWVDGRRVTADFTSLTNGGGGTYRMRITFPDRRFREIRIESTSMFFSVVTVGPTDTVYPPARSATVAAFIGDSFTQSYQSDNWAGTCARILGWEPLITGSGGTGYTAINGSHEAAAERLAATVLDADPDVIVFALGINDSLTGLQAAATSLFAEARTDQPNALLVAIGPWAPSSSSATSQAAKGAAIAAAAAATSGMIYIDNLTDPWITGSGTTSALANDGNADLYIGADGIHPNQQGSIYLGTRVAHAIYAALPAR